MFSIFLVHQNAALCGNRLIFSQTSPGFYMSEVKVFWKHCGKRRRVCSVCSKSLLKTLWEKSKLFFSLSVFYPLGELSAIFKFKIVVCKLFQFVIWERVNQTLPHSNTTCPNWQNLQTTKETRIKQMSFFLWKRRNTVSFSQNVLISLMIRVITTENFVITEWVIIFYQTYFFLSHNNPCFPCNIAIRNFLVSHMCEIRFHNVTDHCLHHDIILCKNSKTWPNEYVWTLIL